MRLHGMAGCIQAFIAKSGNGAFRCRYDAVDERLGDVELNLVALDEDVDNL